MPTLRRLDTVPYKDPTDPVNVEAARAARRRQYHANKSAYKDRARDRQEQLRRLCRELKDVPCPDCGNKFLWYVMDFDHRPGVAKVATINTLVAQGAAVERIRAEISKCDVVCANCHRIRTHERAVAADAESADRLF